MIVVLNIVTVIHLYLLFPPLSLLFLFFPFYIYTKMNDIKRQSLEELGPRVPTHEMNNQPLDISPTPSKSIHRSKTVRNLNSAGSKMRGLFKSKNKEVPPTSNRRMTTSDENGFITRPILSTSASYGPGTEHHQKGNLQSAPFVCL